MDKKYIIERSGKSFVLYAGLLHEAHEHGLQGIRTHLTQAPTDANDQTAIAHAAVAMSGDRFFEGIGDANPKNVNRMVAAHIIRMAECVPMRARILTRSGWRPHHDLAIGDLVLAYDLQTDTCRWTPLECVSRFAARDVPPLTQFDSRSFSAACTPAHTWVVRSGTKRVLRQAQDLRPSDSIIVAAPAESGSHRLTPLDAALLGWLATDGTIRNALVAGRYGPYLRAVIRQSKPAYVDELRELTATVASESASPGRVRDFGSYESECLPQHTFNLRTDYALGLLDRLGWHPWPGPDAWSRLPEVVTRLSSQARSAMLDAMLKGDGSGGTGRGWVFGKRRKPGVMEAFEILATLEGIALGQPRLASAGEVPVRTLRRNRLVTAAYLRQRRVQPEDVWCPTTRYGTWVMNLDGCITITGNTRAKARALRDALDIEFTAVEEIDADTDEVKPDENPGRGGGPRTSHVDQSGRRPAGTGPAVRDQAALHIKELSEGTGESARDITLRILNEEKITTRDWNKLTDAQLATIDRNACRRLSALDANPSDLDVEEL